MNKKYIPYEKLSKKAKRERDAAGRITWGSLSPVTRKPARPDAYDRNREKRRWKNGSDGTGISGGCFV